MPMHNVLRISSQATPRLLVGSKLKFLNWKYCNNMPRGVSLCIRHYHLYIDFFGNMLLKIIGGEEAISKEYPNSFLFYRQQVLVYMRQGS